MAELQRIPLVDVARQFAMVEEEAGGAVLEVLKSGSYILGPQVAELEREIASYLGVTPDDVLEALETSEAYNFVSLETDRSSDGSDSFSILDYIGKDDQFMAVVDDRTTLSAALKYLTPQEQRVLYLRFFQGLTQTEIAKQLGISQMQVSRLLRKTLRVLRENLVPEGVE